MTQLTAQRNGWTEPHQAFDGIAPIDALYNRLDGAYPNKWRSSFASDQAVKNWREAWAEAFSEEGIKPADIKAGLKACRTLYDWPPSLTEFLKACKPSLDPAVAYYEALYGVQARDKGELGEWTHPAIFWAATKMAYDLKSQTYSSIKTRWEATLQAELAKGKWEEIKLPLIALAPVDRAAITKENAARMVKEITAAMLEPKDDQKGWAREIIRRQKEGDTTLTLLQVQFAQEALSDTRSNDRRVS